MTGVLALGLTAAAQADVTIYLTGSTACRNAVYAAIHGSMFAPGFKEVTYGNSTAAKCNQMLWSGTVSGISGTTTIKAAWSGSVGGIASVTLATNSTSFPNGSIAAGNYPNTTTSNPGGDGLVNPYEAAPGHPAHICMADNFQSSSLFTSPILGDDNVGVIEFKWCKNAGSISDSHWANLTNISDEVIRTVLAGPVKLSVFTSVTADTNYVYAIGRNNDSGSRVQAFGDSGYGIQSSCVQFAVSNSVSGAFPSVFPDDSFGTGGNSGYASGGDVANAAGTAGSASATDPNFAQTGWYGVSYLSIGDSATLIGKGGAELTYNGVPFSDQAVREGRYTFWGNEHVLSTPGLSGDLLTVKNDLVKLLNGTTASYMTNAGVLNSTMNVSKATDGSDPTHN